MRLPLLNTVEEAATQAPLAWATDQHEETHMSATDILQRFAMVLNPIVDPHW